MAQIGGDGESHSRQLFSGSTFHQVCTNSGRMFALDASLFIILALALVLDALLGEPEWLWRRAPHPAVVMGRVVTGLEAMLNQGGYRRLKGAAALVLLVIGAGAIGFTLAAAPGIGPVFSVLLRSYPAGATQPG